MQEWDEYRQTKIEKGELIDRIKNKTQKDWIKVCETLGIKVRTDLGKGSHAVAYKNDCPFEDRRCCIVTLQKDLHSEIQRDIFKKILTHGQKTGLYKEDDMWKALEIDVEKLTKKNKHS